MMIDHDSVVRNDYRDHPEFEEKGGIVLAEWPLIAYEIKRKF
tara:strand:+ start:773 stop:898 length:126 start_codon:yes stop_codon:yes gene_type:complete